MTVITFLTDFGLQDDFVGTCHGVIAGIAPEARVIDVTHGIAPQAVLQGALVLRNTTRYLPVGVHLAVVDPGVGGNRRAIAVATADGRTFVGPDNGLLMLAADELGVAAAHELANDALPAARGLAHVPRTRRVRAGGGAPRGRRRDRRARARARPRRRSSGSTCPIRRSASRRSRRRCSSVDRFGNVATNARRAHIDALGLANGDRVEVRIALDRYYAFVAGTFADAVPGELILYEDSYGLVTLAISSGDAARLTGAVGGRRAADRRHMTPGQRFARLVTTVVVRVPFLWRLFRAPLTRSFDRLAPEWDATRVSRERLAPMVAALESLPDPPARGARRRHRHRRGRASPRGAVAATPR